MPEIEVAGEPWLGLVVLRNASRPMDQPGYYSLANAAEWHSDSPYVTVWAGPNKRDEMIARTSLVEEDCWTVQVDERGFYTCPPILEDLLEDVKGESEKLLNEMANERAAESYSYVDAEEAHDRYGEEVFVKAEFGDSVAVNGELASDLRPPRNYELTDMGGSVPGGTEQYVQKEHLIYSISTVLTKRLKRPIYEYTVEELLNKLYPKDEIAWSSDNGHVEVWASKRAIRKAESDEEREAREKEERYQRMIKQDRQRIEAEKKREAEYRRERIKRGGFPGPKDWSPRGRLPGER
jgi:hypothetical protein